MKKNNLKVQIIAGIMAGLMVAGVLTTAIIMFFQ